MRRCRGDSGYVRSVCERGGTAVPVGRSATLDVGRLVGTAIWLTAAFRKGGLRTSGYRQRRIAPNGGIPIGALIQ
jgi:hypothetical protein